MEPGAPTSEEEEEEGFSLERLKGHISTVIYSTVIYSTVVINILWGRKLKTRERC